MTATECLLSGEQRTSQIEAANWPIRMVTSYGRANYTSV